jgi:hypothetical protein
MGFLGPDGTGKSSAMKILLTPEGEGTALAQVAIASFEGYDSGSGPWTRARTRRSESLCGYT